MGGIWGGRSGAAGARPGACVALGPPEGLVSCVLFPPAETGGPFTLTAGSSTHHASWTARAVSPHHAEPPAHCLASPVTALCDMVVRWTY